jgi:glycosyltransferase involved in cell wall biosynthesis
MDKSISLIIPNYNGSSTIGKCLEAALASRYGNFEVVVVDDCSEDNSVEIIKQFPVRLIALEEHSGAPVARNRGAEESRGEILFFTDADCLIRDDALSLANEAMAQNPGAVIGGTYTPLPLDTDFFSTFQSLFIHYSETKKKEPDYIAAHAMVMEASLFRKSAGFPQHVFAIPEDVKFSHILRRMEHRLIMKPEIEVTHVFNFTFLKSLRNAFRKAMLWTIYSLENHDLLTDSGTASSELKINGASFFLTVVCGFLFISRQEPSWLALVPFLFGLNLFASRGLLRLFVRSRGSWFTIVAALYYTIVYPLPVLAGGLVGITKHGLMRGDGKGTIVQS